MRIDKKNAFYSIIFLKLILIFSFSSEYSSDLFFPFLNSISFENINPWILYYEEGLVDHFPYHGLMLIILAPFAFIGEFIGGNHYIIKLPLLIADIAIFLTLIRLFANKEKEIFIFYFLNPVIIYGIYVHSQLDIIPTALLFMSIYFLTQRKINYSSTFFGLAMATKFHVIIALPIILFYLFKKNELKKLFKYIIISSAVLFVFDFPFFSEAFVNMVVLNPKQSLLFDAYYSIGSLNLLLPVTSICFVYFHFFNQNKVNQDLLFFYFGLLFTATIFFIYPGPAWYVWMIPFVSIYFIKSNNYTKSLILHFAFSASYVLFIVFFYESEYKDIVFFDEEIDLKIENDNLRNLSFTLVEVILCAIMYTFYKYGIKSNSIYDLKTNLAIGIGGDSSSGKSTMLHNLKEIFDDKLVEIEGDGDHKWERGSKNWEKFTHLDPKANFMHKQADVIKNLKNNLSIFRRDYNHSTGKFTKPVKVNPKEFIVIAGLHPFYLPKLRKNIDLKIYLDTDEDLRIHWKVLRDTKNRGYKIDNVLKQIKIRETDSKKYIHPQKDFADLIFNFFPLKKIKVKNKDISIDLGLKVTFNANVNFENILAELNCNYNWNYNDDLKSQFIELKNPPLDNFGLIALKTIDNLDELISYKPNWKNGYEGFVQLVCIKMISEKLKENN